MATNPVELKLLIDKENNRVVFAESEKYFVDTLFSFLTIPIGALLWKVGKKSNVGCMDALYEAVEKLDSNYFQTEAAKHMLLRPRSAADDLTKDLKLSIDPGKKLQENFSCSSWDCATGTRCLISPAQGTQCSCGQPMNRITISRRSPPTTDGEDGVFVKGANRFTIGDDLQVSPVSTGTFLSLHRKLLKLGIRERSFLEEKTLKVGPEEALHLMNQSLVSNTPLTDIFLGDKSTLNDLKFSHVDLATNPSGEDGNGSNKMSLKLLLCNDKVLYAEATEEFVNLLFSFLTLPLGSLVKLLGPASSLGCFNNLYKSVEILSHDNCIKSEKCRDALLDPKLAAHFSCENQLMKLVEADPWTISLPKCQMCFKNNDCGFSTNCKHGLGWATLHSFNPKQRNGGANCGGFLKGLKMMFMITDGLDVKPFSLLSCISLLDRFDIPTSDLQELEVSMGEEEALSLLKLSLGSKTVLTDVFHEMKQRYEIKLPTRSQVKMNPIDQ